MFGKIFIALFFICGAQSFTIPEGQCSIDVPKFTGGWYEIATSNFVSRALEAGCTCPVAYYTLNSTNADNMDLKNACYRFGSYSQYNGSLAQIDGYDGNFRAFISPFEKYNSSETYDFSDSNYIILQTWSESGSYSDALIGGSDADHWWLISRSPNMNSTVLGKALLFLQAYDYNIENYHNSTQDTNCLFLGGSNGGGPLLSTAHE